MHDDNPVGFARRPDKPDRAPAPGGRGMNIFERFELAKQQARVQGRREPTFDEYADDTFASTTTKPAPPEVHHG